MDILALATETEAGAKFSALLSLNSMQAVIEDARRRIAMAPPDEALRIAAHALAAGNMNAMMEIQSGMSKMFTASMMRAKAAEQKP